MDWLQAQSMARGGHVMRRESWPMDRVIAERGGELVVTKEAEEDWGLFEPTAEDRTATDWAKVLEGDDQAQAQPDNAKVEGAEQ